MTNIFTTNDQAFLQQREPFRYPENATTAERIQLLKNRIASELIYWDLKHQVKVIRSLNQIYPVGRID